MNRKLARMQRKHWISLGIATLVVGLILAGWWWLPVKAPTTLPNPIVPNKEQLSQKYSSVEDGARFFSIEENGEYPSLRVGINDADAQVICGEVTYHLPFPDQVVGSKECSELFTPQGVAVQIVSNANVLPQFLAKNAAIVVIKGGQWEARYEGVLLIWRAVIRLQPLNNGEEPLLTIE